MQFLSALIVSLVFSISAQAATKTQAPKKMPTKQVVATPLQLSQAAKMRKKREKMEVETEEKFMQKLERARLEDEVKRRQQLLGKELRAVSPSTQVSAPAPDIRDFENDLDTYFTIGGGALSYPDVDFVPGANGAFGTALGIGLGSDFWLEGNFVFSYQEAEFNTPAAVLFEDIDHYSVGGAFRYSFGYTRHWITPLVGVGINYTRREFDAGDRASNAYDASLQAGVEFALNPSRSVKLGFDTRYVMNIDYQDELVEDLDPVVQNANIEDNNYLVLLLNSKFLF